MRQLLQHAFLSTTGGRVLPGAKTNLLVTLNSTANQLAVGSYSDTLKFTNTMNNAGNTHETAALYVNLLPPELGIGLAGTNILLTWPTNYPGFTLQFATNLVPPVAWSPVSLLPVVANGQSTVTNSLSGTKCFYRLLQ